MRTMPKGLVRCWILGLCVCLLVSLTGAGKSPAAEANLTLSRIETKYQPNLFAYVTVTDENGVSIKGLDIPNFMIEEDSEGEITTMPPRRVTTLQVQGDTLSYLLIIDSSGSMREVGGANPVQDAIDAAISVVDSVEDYYRGAVIDFDGTARLLQDFTTNKVALRAALNSITAIKEERTALYDALVMGAGAMDAIEGLKAVILLSDGANESSSPTTYQDALDAVLGADVPFYVVGLGGLGLDSTTVAILQDVADQSKGQYFPAGASTQLASVFMDIFEVIKYQYILYYKAGGDLQMGFVKPPAGGEEADESYEIRWWDYAPSLWGQHVEVTVHVTYGGSSDSDTSSYTAPDLPETLADIDLYYDKDNTGFNGTAIAYNIPQRDDQDARVWDIRALADGDYYIYGIMSTAEAGVEDFAVYSQGPVRIDHYVAYLDVTLSVNASGFPTVANTVTVRDENGAPIVGLVSGNFAMTEGGSAVSETVAALGEPGRYSVNYVTPNFVEDATVRTVRVVVSYSNHGTVATGEDTRQYTAPSGTPSIVITEPPPEGDATSSDTYTIQWVDSDPNSNASIKLEYALVSNPTDRTVIVTGISENDPANAYPWNVAGLTKGRYYVFGTINDGYNPPVVDQSGDLLLTDRLEVTINQILTCRFPTVQAVVSVSDPNHEPILGLTKEDFALDEAGQDQNIISVVRASTNVAISYLLVLDSSGSMRETPSGNPMQDARNAAKIFIELTGDQDRGAVVDFDEVVNFVQDFTTDKEALTTAVDAITAIKAEGTALYSAMIEAASRIQTAPTARKAVIVLSDGRDEDSPSGSLGLALVAARDAGVPFYMVGLQGLGLDPASEGILQDFADTTGAMYLPSPSPAELQEVYEKISRALQNQYIVTYATDNDAVDFQSRNVHIEVGYFDLTGEDSRYYDATGDPCMVLKTPPRFGATSDSTLLITWYDNDPDDDATISLFYDADDFGFDGTPIPGAGHLSEDADDTSGSFLWDVSGLPADSRWYVYAEITDGVSVGQAYSPGRLTVLFTTQITGDFNGDSVVGLADFVMFVNAYGSTSSAPDWDPAFDLDGNGSIGLGDFVIFVDNYGREGGPTKLASPGTSQGRVVCLRETGQRTTLTVRIEQVEAVRGCGVALQYDRETLAFSGVADGGLYFEHDGRLVVACRLGEGEDPQMKLWFEPRTAGSPAGAIEVLEAMVLNASGVVCDVPVAAAALPSAYRLYPAAPNPFNPRTEIAFDVPAGATEATVTLDVCDVRGRLVRRLVHGSVAGGRHRVVWDGRNEAGQTVSSGVYVCRLLTEGLVSVQRMMLVK